MNAIELKKKKEEKSFILLFKISKIDKLLARLRKKKTKSEMKEERTYPVLKTLSFQYRGHKIDAWLGN